MVEKVIRVISVLAIVALLAGIIYEAEMPDLLKRANINPKKVAAEEISKEFNQEYYEYCEEVRSYLERSGDVEINKAQLKQNFDHIFEAKATLHGMEYSFDQDYDGICLGRMILTKKNRYDRCYEEAALDADVEGNGVNVDDFDLIIEDHIVCWYCKKDGNLAAVSPYHLYETDWAIGLDQIIPGFCDWLKEMEDTGMEAVTKDGQKIKVIDFSNPNAITMDTSFKGLSVYYSDTEISFMTNPSEIFCFGEITEVKDKLTGFGWELDRYFVDGVDKGFVVDLKPGTWSPTARVIVKDGAISRLEINYADYNIIENEYLDLYQKGLTALLREAGIDDSVKDVLNGEVEQSNYKVYTKAGDSETEEVEPEQYEEFERFMVVIYDIQ